MVSQTNWIILIDLYTISTALNGVINTFDCRATFFITAALDFSSAGSHLCSLVTVAVIVIFHCYKHLQIGKWTRYSLLQTLRSIINVPPHSNRNQFPRLCKKVSIRCIHFTTPKIEVPKECEEPKYLQIQFTFKPKQHSTRWEIIWIWDSLQRSLIWRTRGMTITVTQYY